MTIPSAPCRPSPAVGLLISGGLDSCILLSKLLGEGESVQPLYIASNFVWQADELQALRRFLRAMASPCLAELVVLDLPLEDVYAGHWSVTGLGTPDASTEDAAVYQPGRNALLLIKAAVWCHLRGIRRLALAPLQSNPFPDATTEFFDDFASVLNRGMFGGLQIERPFSSLGKRQVMELGRRCPLALTFSCIAPLAGLHCGWCNKCAERQAAFDLIDQPDPTPYASRQCVLFDARGPIEDSTARR